MDGMSATQRRRVRACLEACMCDCACAGEMLPLWLGPMQEDKLPKDATPGGHACMHTCSILHSVLHQLQEDTRPRACDSSPEETRLMAILRCMHACVVTVQESQECNMHGTQPASIIAVL